MIKYLCLFVFVGLAGMVYSQCKVGDTACSINPVISNTTEVPQSNAKSQNTSDTSSSVEEEDMVSVNYTNVEAISYKETDLFNKSTQCHMRLVNATLQCQNETGATQEDVDKAIRMEIPSTETGKCLMRCLLKQRGWMTPEGMFSLNATAEYLTNVHKDEELKPEFVKLAEFCYEKLKEQPIANVDTCQFAYDIAVCVDDYHKTIFPKKKSNSPPVNAITIP